MARSILVVEDDRDIQEALCSVLRDEGYHVSSASDGQEAIAQLLAGERPGIILLDIMMPVMDGTDFRRAQLGRPELKDIPVVVLTADGGYRDIGRSLGAAAALAKPFDLRALLGVIARVMGLGGQPRATA